LIRCKAIATDVDGTLTSKISGISTNAINAIRKIEAKGIPIILASARPYPILNILREYLQTSGAIICENGGYVDYGGESRILGDNTECSEFMSLLTELYGEQVQEAWTNRYNIVDLALKRTLQKKDILNVLSNYPQLRLIDSGFFYHILNIKVNKGKGLKVAAEMMNIETNDIIAVGDSEVDIELLQEAGYGIAVGNASDELKKIANHVTVKRNGQGFTEGISNILNI
jgi:phosphoglycolate phosphatase (TIGR01487 family)